jgi:integrase
MSYCISTVVRTTTGPDTCEVPASAAALAMVASFRPVSVDEEAACFARAVVRAARPESPVRAKALLFATSRLAGFSVSVGLELDPEKVLDPSVIERFILCGTAGLTVATRRTLRANLRFVARRVRDLAPGPVPLARGRAKPAYSQAEIASYLATAKTQPTASRRMRLAGLICLGAGAGLIGGDLRAVRGRDVISRSGGLVVSVAGRRPRVVPVLSRYHELLIESAAFAGEGYVIGGEDPFRQNVTTPLLSATAGGLHQARLETSRLRSSWLRDAASQIGLATFMAAAGISCSQRLGDIVAGLDGASEQEAVVLLGATS